MARQPRSTTSTPTAPQPGDDEKVTVLGNGPIVEVEPTFGDNEVVADATTKGPQRDESKVPKAKRYQVTRGGMIMNNGYRTRLGVGKVIDDLNYDIKKLVQQGIALTEVPESGELPVGVE